MPRFDRRHGFFAAAMAVGFALLTPLHAHEGATGPTAARMAGMGELGQAFKLVRTLAPDAPAADRTSAIDRLIAEAMAIPALFADRDLPAISEALPAIWAQPAQFDAAATELIEAARALTDNWADDTASARVATACRACHDQFRAKK